MGERERKRAVILPHCGLVLLLKEKKGKVGYLWLCQSLVCINCLIILIKDSLASLWQLIPRAWCNTWDWDWEGQIGITGNLLLKEKIVIGMWTKKDLEMEFVQYFDQEMTFICPTPPPPTLLPFLKNTLSPVILMVVRNWESDWPLWNLYF